MRRRDNIRVVTWSQLKTGDFEASLLCGGCGHNLFGASGRCPECGRAFDPGRRIDELIPWEQRKYAGRISTFLRTAYLATFRPRMIAKMVESPVSYRSARLFRRICVCAGFAPLLMLGLSFRWSVARGGSADDWTPIFRDPLSFWVLMFGILLGLQGAAAITSWPFHVRRLSFERRGRAIAVSCYASAALVWIVVIAAILSISLALSGVAHRNPPIPEFILSELQYTPSNFCKLCALVFLPMTYSMLVMLRVATRCGAGRLIAAGLLLPIGWAVVLVAAPALCELLLAMGYLLVRSFS